MNQRIKEIRKALKLTQAVFAESLGLEQGSYSDLERGKVKSISSSIQVLLKEKYNVNIDYLLNGAGPMFNEVRKIEAAPINPNIMMVPLVHQYAYAGYLCGFSDPEYIDSLPKIPFFVDHNGKGNYLSFEVKGDSMFDGSYNSYLEGDRILCREIKKEHWRNKLHINKWNFVIIHRTEGILIKQIIKHDIEQGLITIHSLNPEYDDQVLSLNDVDKLFNVIELVRGRP